MARAAKKSTRKTAARGAPGKKSAPARTQKKRRGQSQKPDFAAEPQRLGARKRGRPPGSGRKASTAAQAGLVTAQLEAINNKLQSIVGLRNDIQDLRDSIEVLSGAVDAMLKANRGSIETAAEQEEPQAAGESVEYVAAGISELPDAE